jgi:PelA/Pel-15E family pectate lyase
MRINERVFFVLVLCILFVSVEAHSEQGPSKQEVLRTLRKATEFYVTKVANEGGYHDVYAEDLGYGHSSKAGRGPTQVSATGAATPNVGLAFLAVWEATGDRYYLEAARLAAHAMVKGQMCSGGWDYTTNLDPATRKKYRYRTDVNCCEQASDKRNNMTNFDNNTTQGVLRLLIRVDRALNFEDNQIHQAALYALDNLIRAQYPNGAWPQRYEKFPDPNLFPVKPASYPDSWSRTGPGTGLYSHYTFNDDVIVNMIDVMLEAASIYKEPRYQASAEKAGDFIILAQMPDPQPAWAQQYDVQMHPAWGRAFEPPAVTGRESVSVMRVLILLYKETGKKKYLEPIPRALDYLKRSSWVRDGKPVIARFYELKTNQPIYIAKDTREITYSDKSTISHYSLVTSAEPLSSIGEEYRSLLKAHPATLRRSDKPRCLTPGTGVRMPPLSLSAAELSEKVRAVISSLDERGAWVQQGSTGDPGLVLSVKPAKEMFGILRKSQILPLRENETRMYEDNMSGAGLVISIRPAKDMVVLLGGKVLPLKEGETLEVHKGAAPPSREVIRSGTFAENLRLLANYLTVRWGLASSG